MKIDELKIEKYGFVTKNDLPEVIKENPDEPLLVRCGGCRFVTTAIKLNHFMKVINTSDYVRDVSVYYEKENLRNFCKIITGFGFVWVSRQDRNIVADIINNSKVDYVIM